MKKPDARWRFGLFLALIAVIAAIPRLLLGASQFIEYDGYWHVFIAQQDNWHNFWSEINSNAHPPLYFLLLKLAIRPGRSLLIYRSISLLTGVASVFLAGWIAKKITKSSLWAYQTALAYGLALPGIIISCEVRSYMLSAFFILLSFWYLLDLISGDTQQEGKLRTGFAVAAILACLSHYYAFFYAGASVFLLAARFAVRRYKRTGRCPAPPYIEGTLNPGGADATRCARVPQKRQDVSWKAEAATIIPVLGAIYGLFQAHVHLHAQIQSHLLPYYYDPAGKESVAAFLLRNWKNFLNLFSPYMISSDAVAVTVLVIALAGGGALLGFFLRARDATDLRASWTILITATMLGAIVLSSIAGKYPFGGDLRQQYILFPFLALCAGLLADRLTAFMRGKGQWVLHAAIAVSIAGISLLRFEQYPRISENVLRDRIDLFDKLEPEPTAVYLDQFNLITFFLYHHTWQWSFLDREHPTPDIDVYRLRKGSRQMLVFRDRSQWNLQPEDNTVYYKLAACLKAEKIRDVSIFCARQSPPQAPFSDLKKERRTIVTQASHFTVCAQRLAVDPVGWFGTFRASNCTAADLRPPRVTGGFDDVSDEIEFGGVWTPGSFAPAAGGTDTYSNAAGSVARLSFEGQELTYVYAKARNRGIAAVRIDGIPRGEVDLYSPKIVWQSHTTFANLAPGPHTFELTVLGRKNAAATDQYVDVDELIVR